MFLNNNGVTYQCGKKHPGFRSDSRIAYLTAAANCFAIPLIGFSKTFQILFLIIFLSGCGAITPSKPDVPVTQETSSEVFLRPESPTLSIGLLPDHSGSFKGEIEKLNRESLHPIKEFFQRKSGTQSLLIAYVTDNSDKLLLRYSDIPSLWVPKVDEAETNPWEDQKVTPHQNALTKNAVIDSANAAAWILFTSKVEARDILPHSKKSDIITAFNRVIIGLQEQKGGQKYLIAGTDFLDTYSGFDSFPDIPEDITLIVVGGVAKLPKNIKKYIRFESISSAINEVINNN